MLSSGRLSTRPAGHGARGRRRRLGRRHGGRRGRSSSSARRSRGRGRQHAQHLPHLHQVRVVEIVPACHVAPVLPMVERDAQQRVAGLGRVEARLAGVLSAGRGLGCRQRHGRNGRNAWHRPVAWLRCCALRPAPCVSMWRSPPGPQWPGPPKAGKPSCQVADACLNCPVTRYRILEERNAPPHASSDAIPRHVGPPPAASGRHRDLPSAPPAGRRRPAAPARPPAAHCPQPRR